MEELATHRITSFVDRPILLRVKLRWSHGDAKIPEAPTPSGEITKRIVGGLKVVFENYQKYVPEGRLSYESGRGDFFVVSPKLIKVRDKDNREQFAFDGRTLSNGDRAYVLSGRIQYRAWLQIDETKLTKQFVEQSDNPAYWGQTFEFELVDIAEEQSAEQDTPADRGRQSHVPWDRP